MRIITRITGAPVLAAGVLSFAGCASVINDATHSVRVDVRTATGQSIDGAACVAFNDRGTTAFKSGTSQLVRRSAAQLHFACTYPGLPPALGISTSRANAGLAGNLVVGGLVGAAIDHSQGTGYTYPTWIQMEFGKALLFDRTLEKAGQPVTGYAPGNTPPQLVHCPYGANFGSCSR